MHILITHDFRLDYNSFIHSLICLFVLQGYSTPTCSGKIANCTGIDGKGVRVTEPRGSCAYKDVTYTVYFCNKDQYPLQFQTGTCNYTANGAPWNSRTGPCSYAYVNQTFVSADFSSNLAAGACRTATVVTKVNTCAVVGTQLSASVPSQIQIQGLVNGNYCRAFAFLSVVYQAADPPLTRKPTAKKTQKPTAKPTSQPTVKPTAKPSQKPSFRPTAQPTAKPTPKPSQKPSFRPTARPTAKPTRKPSQKPSFRATLRSKKGRPYQCYQLCMTAKLIQLCIIMKTHFTFSLSLRCTCTFTCL